MHELAIAQSIMETVLDEKLRLELDTIEGVTVRVGALSGVLPDALQFSFDAIRVATQLEQCQLTIETVPITVRCRKCEKNTRVENYLFVCPTCTSTDVEVITGYELDIAYLEIPDDTPEIVHPEENMVSNGTAN